MTTNDDTTRAIAQALRERAPTPCGHIKRIVQCCGADQARAWLTTAQAIEANGGMLTHDGSRRRTPGGVYFHLVRQELLAAHRHDDLRHIFGRPMWHKGGTDGHHACGTRDRPASSPPVTWDTRSDLVRDASEQYGKVTRVNITISGKPARTVELQHCTLLMLTHNGPLPALPKGIPVPAQVPETTYIVYIGAKQWKKVKEAVTDPDDTLIVEGVPIYDAPHGAIAVFATSATTKALQRAKRQA